MLKATRKSEAITLLPDWARGLNPAGPVLFLRQLFSTASDGPGSEHPAPGRPFETHR